MTTDELQSLLDSGGTLPAGDIVLSRPLFVTGDVQGQKTHLHTANTDALIALPGSLRFFDPSPYFPVVPNTFVEAYRTNGNSCIRFLNTPGDWIQNCNTLNISMKLRRWNNGGSIAGLACNKRTNQSENFPPSPWVLHTHNDWPGFVALHLRLSTGARHTLRWRLDNMGIEQVVEVAVSLASASVSLKADGVTLPIADGVIPPSGSKFADNETSALFLGAVSQQACEKGEWGCCDCEMRDVSISYGGAPFVPYLGRPTYGLPLIAYNGGFGLLQPTGVNDWSKGVRIRDLTFSGARWGAAVTLQSGLRSRFENLTVNKHAVGVQVLGGPLNCYPVTVTDLYHYAAYDCPLRIQRGSEVVVRRLYADYPTRSVARFDICGMTTVRDVFQAPEGQHITKDCLRFDRCCHIDVARCDFNYEDNVGPANSYIRVVGDPCDTSPPPYLGLTHVAGKYKGIDVSGSPWGLMSVPTPDGPKDYPINTINTIMPVYGIGVA